MAKHHGIRYNSEYSYFLEESIPFYYRVVGYADWIEASIPKLFHADALIVRPQNEEHDLVPAFTTLWSTNSIGLDLETSGEKEKDGLDPVSSTSRIMLMQVGNRKCVFVCQPELIPFFRPIFESPNLLHVNQNLTFDFEWLLAKHGIHTVRLFCTMLAEQLLQAGKDGYTVTLQDLARTYYPYRMISKEIRSQFINHSGVFNEEQIYYAARDVYLLFDIMMGQNAALQRHKLMDVARIEFNVIPVTAEMELTGVCLNQEVMELIIDYWSRRQVQLEQEIKIAFNEELQKNGKKGTKSFFDSLFEDLDQADFESFDLDSNEQKLSALRRIGLNPDNAQRKTLKAIEHRLTKLMVEYSVVRKRVTTYGRPMLERVHPDDGRLHASFKQLGIGDFASAASDRTQTIATGRYSSNFQQLPRPEEVYEIITDPAELADLRQKFDLLCHRRVWARENRGEENIDVPENVEMEKAA